MCRAQGAPDISFMWSRLGRVILEQNPEDGQEEAEEAENAKDQKYEVKTKMIDR